MHPAAVEAEFLAAMRAAGVEPADPAAIAADGVFRRFRLAGDRPGAANGWAILYGDNLPTGQFASWKTGGTPATWSAKGKAEFTPAERRRHAERLAAMREARRTETETRHRESAAEAARIWEAATPAAAPHPYLVRKGILPLGIRQAGDDLLIPLRDGTGALCSLQTITPAGDKRFLAGGRVAGCQYTINGTLATVFVCEGFATGGTIAAATGAAVVCGMHCGNLLAVAETARKTHPAATLIIAADNDTRTPGNPGLSKGRAAAIATGAALAWPRFAEGEEGSDFNDLAALHGLPAVVAALSDRETPVGTRPAVDLSGEWLGVVRAVAGAVAPASEIFFRAGEVVRLDAAEGHFEPLTPAGACSELERFCRFVKPGRDDEPEPGRLCEATARLILAAPEFVRLLPKIETIADYPMPVWRGKRLGLTRPGYDPETRIFTRPGVAIEAPPLADGLDILSDLLADFCFADLDGDGGLHYGSAALAYLLSCHCRLLFEPTRAPLFYAAGNRPGVGKDYLLGLGPLLATGKLPQFYPPTATADETRKRILAVCRAGARFMLVSNCRGHLADEALEQAATSPTHCDRVLGKSEELSLPNSAVYGLSGNQLSYSEDLARRMLPIELAFFDESIETRQYRHPDLYRFALANRGRILGALQSMVNAWAEAGTPDGKADKASFGAWARIVGGILEACNMPNPIGRDPLIAAPTQETEHFAALLKELRNRHGAAQFGKDELQATAADLDLFPWLGDMATDRSAKTRLGKILARMQRRRFAGLALLADRTTQRPRWQVLEG